MDKINKSSQQKTSSNTVFKHYRNFNQINENKYKSQPKPTNKRSKDQMKKRNCQFDRCSTKKKESTSQRIQPNSKMYLTRKRKNEKLDGKKAELAASAEGKLARIQNQKAKRLERTIAISKKTKRGQPLMKDRINYLLKKIECSKT